MMKVPKYIAFISSFLIATIITAQESMMSYNAGITYHYGFMMAHRNDLKVMVKGYTRATEFSFSMQHNGDKDWEVKYSYPFTGVSLIYIDFANPDQLGHGISLMAFYDFPLFRKKNFDFAFKIGFGPGYVEKIFDKEENYKNFAVSTHFNGFAYGNFHGRYEIGKRWLLSGGLSILHFSNASASKPNLGINLVTLNMGLAYSFREVDKKGRDEGHDFTYNKKWQHEIVPAFGRKSKEIEGTEFGIFSLAYEASRQVSFKSRLGGGADVFYNTAHRNENGRNDYILESNADLLQIGLNFYYVLQISKMSLFLNQGVYVYTKYFEDGGLYNRFGMRYHITDHLMINLSMKTHFAVADHVEFGIGYRL